MYNGKPLGLGRVHRMPVAHVSTSFAARMRILAIAPSNPKTMGRRAKNIIANSVHDRDSLKLLDSFWEVSYPCMATVRSPATVHTHGSPHLRIPSSCQARGVFDAEQRSRLVEAGRRMPEALDEATGEDRSSAGLQEWLHGRWSDADRARTFFTEVLFLCYLKVM